MDSQDYVIDGDLAFGSVNEAMNFYQSKYHEQIEEIKALKEILKVKVILNEHAQQSMQQVKNLLKSNNFSTK